VIAVDTNILVYAESPSSEFHTAARELLVRLAQERKPWAIPWPCVYEFLRVMTHPRGLGPPLSIETALYDLTQILKSSTVQLLAETPRHFEIMDLLLRESRVTANRIHDAHVAALCIEHGIDEIITGDRDFTRFPLKVTNPFRP
jgi:toxin-antitoxin system PIN domain toxin